jgi:hypothetical protein
MVAREVWGAVRRDLGAVGCALGLLGTYQRWGGLGTCIPAPVVFWHHSVAEDQYWDVKPKNPVLLTHFHVWATE